MILAIQNKRPSIGFGLGATTIETEIGQEVTIWLDQIYNSECDVDIIKDASITVSIANFNKFTVTPSEAGSFDIYLELITADKKNRVKSNKIKLIVS